MTSKARYADAEPLYKRSLAIWEKALGPDHPEVGTSLNNLADLYRDQGRYADAEPLYKRSQAIYEKTLGLDHPYVAQSPEQSGFSLPAQRPRRRRRTSLQAIAGDRREGIRSPTIPRPCDR